MPPDTRTTDLKRIEDSITVVLQDHNLKYELMVDLLKGQNVKLDQTIANQGAQIRDMQGIMSTMAQQLDLALHKLSPHTSSLSQGRDKQVSSTEGYESRHRNSQEERNHSYKIHKPKHFFPVFNGEDVHRWLYKCTQYFEIEEIANTDKLRITSYYLEGVALYWHQNFLRSATNQETTWEEYVEAISCKFGGQQDPLEAIMELKQ